MASQTHTTNVSRGRERVRLTARWTGAGRELVWAELYVAGELKGCGPTLVGVGGDLLHDCEMRLADGFEHSMLWRREGRFGVYVNRNGGEHLCGYLRRGPDLSVTPWAREAARFDTIEDARAEIQRRSLVESSFVRVGFITAYPCEVPA